MLYRAKHGAISLHDISKPPLSTRRGAPDAHDALPSRLPKHKKHAMPWGEPHRSCFEDGRAPDALSQPPGRET